MKYLGWFRTEEVAEETQVSEWKKKLTHQGLFLQTPFLCWVKNVLRVVCWQVYLVMEFENGRLIVSVCEPLQNVVSQSQMRGEWK